MELYLLRHGIAEDARTGVPDSARELTAEGAGKDRRGYQNGPKSRRSPLIGSDQPLRAGAPDRADCFRGTGIQEAHSSTRFSGASQYAGKRLARCPGPRRRNGGAADGPRAAAEVELAAFLLNAPALRVEIKKTALLRIGHRQRSQSPSRDTALDDGSEDDIKLIFQLSYNHPMTFRAATADDENGWPPKSRSSRKIFSRNTY